VKLTGKQRHALYKTAAAETFRTDGPQLTPELAREAYGDFAKTSAERASVIDSLFKLRLVERDDTGHTRLTDAGRSAINYTPRPKTRTQR